MAWPELPPEQYRGSTSSDAWRSAKGHRKQPNCAGQHKEVESVGRSNTARKSSQAPHRSGKLAQEGDGSVAGTQRTSAHQAWHTHHSEAGTANPAQSRQTGTSDRPVAPSHPAQPLHLTGCSDVCGQSGCCRDDRSYWPPRNKTLPRVERNMDKTAGVINTIQMEGKISKAIGISILIGAL